MQMLSIYQSANMAGIAALAFIPQFASYNTNKIDSDAGGTWWEASSPVNVEPIVARGDMTRGSLIKANLSSQFARLRALSDGWDGAGSLAPNLAVMAKAAAVLNSMSEKRGHFLVPQIVPVADGGVQAEWYLQRHRFEMYFYPDGECVAWFQNRETTFEKEAVGLDAVQLLNQWVSSAENFSEL